MRTTAVRRSIITLGVLAVAVTGEAKPSADTAATTPKAPKSERARTEQAPAVDPDAIAALEKMGAYLRQQQQFTVRTVSETDYVLETGQKARLSARGEVRARRPDRLRAEVVSDRKERQLFYDGKTFTIFSPRLGYYASVPAPPTIGETADRLADQYGIQFPLVDLFRWGADETGFDQITRARFIGTAQIDGVETRHYAFRQPGVDWQIWIERGDRPLPRKLVLTTTDDPARPEFALELSWDLDAKHADSVFAFVPPKDSAKIALVDLSALGADQGRRARRGTR
jgi:hypothetical protein